MRIATFLSVFSAAVFASAESIPKTDYDVIVVGGGPAGLSALSGVSRVRRTALLFDNHQYRNDVTREMHDVIGNDGMFECFTSSRDHHLICTRNSTR
jgi:flavin-dependent dehydrogenase